MEPNESASRRGIRATVVVAALAGAALLAGSTRMAHAQAATPPAPTTAPAPPAAAAPATPAAPAMPATPSMKPAAAPKKATAAIEAKSGSQVTGTATFTKMAGHVHVLVEIAGATPGKHGVHIHETGDCSAPDAASAGPHFNPAGKMHGSPKAAMHHAGDLGNILVGPNGKGKLSIMSHDISLKPGPNSIIGKAIVIHADPDDLKSQPAGNSGARIGCGVIQ